jgi:phenylpropionate dioxygenase-like ring-hydroxylating dioxygenase large terminal subunit
MGMLDHWHPVLRSRDLRHKPVGVKVAGQPIAVFRTASGGLGAVTDACPHRRLKLSVGAVVGDRLRCQYHGWSFDRCGRGESPGTPKLSACMTSYDAAERFGLVWVKTRGGRAEIPDLSTPGYLHVCTLDHLIPAPLELAVDNFNEIEHSGTVHTTFGYDLDRMHEVRVRFEPTDTTVRVVNVGPTKRLNPVFRLLLNVRDGDLFHDDWTTHFSPVYSVFDHWWTSPDGTRESMVRWRLYIFYVPVDDRTTQAVSVTYAKSRYPGPGGALRLVRWLFRQQIDREIRADVGMLHHMADYDPDVDGMKLSRFDRVMGLTRERIRRVYRGERTSRLRLA